jgi:hypothetical protein
MIAFGDSALVLDGAYREPVNGLQPPNRSFFRTSIADKYARLSACEIALVALNRRMKISPSALFRVVRLEAAVAPREAGVDRVRDSADNCGIRLTLDDKLTLGI